MTATTFLITMPDGQVATRTRDRHRYVAAVVITVTEAAYLQAVQALERAESAITAQDRETFAALVEAYQAAAAAVGAYTERNENAPRHLWARYDAACAKVYKHPLYKIETVDGLAGGSLSHTARRLRDSIGRSWTQCWNRSMRRAEAEASRARAVWPGHDVQIMIPTIVGAAS